MEIVRTMFEEFRYMGELIAAGLLITLPVAERRSKFWFKLIVGMVALIGYTFLFLLRHWMGDNEILITSGYIIWYISWVLLLMAYLAICFKLKLAELLWIAIFSYVLQHFIYALINEFLFMVIIPADSIPFAVYALTCIVTCVAIYYVVYLWFRSYLKEINRIHLAGSRWLILGYIGMFLLVFFTTGLNQLDAKKILTLGLRDDITNWLPIISDLFNCAFVLTIQYMMLRIHKSRFEKGLATQLQQHAFQQFDAFKEAVNYINSKCHDLKYQIRSARENGSLDEDSMNEIEEKISLFESFADTGNKTLDIILADKYLLCKSKNIAFSYMADAAWLEKMEQSDIYTLFGNMLDNAVEYVQKLENEEKKYIRLSVRPVYGAFMIHLENYFEGKLVFSDGLPVTTKENKNWHGFGLQSIKNIAKKYGGKLEVKAESGNFSIDIMFPLEA